MITITLDTDWVCEYFELDPNLYELATDVRVKSLATWSFDKRRDENWAAWLQRTFTLHPTEECVHYWLLIDSAPQHCRIYINGQAVAYYDVGDDDPPFELDVTDNVWLDDNKLSFRVDHESEGRFEGVRLVAIPCD
jgi:hypothetical protein